MRGRDVDTRVVDQVLLMGEHRGLRRDRLLRGLPISVEESKTAGSLVSWETYIAAVERVCEGVGGDVAFARVAEELPKLTSELNPMLGAFGSTRELLDFWFVALDPRLWRCFTFRTSDLPDGRVRVTIDSPRSRRPGFPVLVATTGSLRAFPHRVGLGDADVDSRITPCHAEFDVRLPKMRPLAPRRRLEALEAFQRFAVAELGFHARELAALSRREPPETNEDDALAHAQAQWNLTARQRDVLLWVVRGLSNKEIAGELGCAEVTVERHVTAIFLKAGARGRANLITRFWRG